MGNVQRRLQDCKTHECSDAIVEERVVAERCDHPVRAAVNRRESVVDAADERLGHRHRLAR